MTKKPKKIGQHHVIAIVRVFSYEGLEALLNGADKHHYTTYIIYKEFGQHHFYLSVEWKPIPTKNERSTMGDFRSMMRTVLGEKRMDVLHYTHAWTECKVDA